MANRFGYLTTMTQNTDTVTSVVLVCCILHNIMRIRYQGIADDEVMRMTLRLVPGQWGQHINLQDMEQVTVGNRDTKITKKQILYLKHYYNAPIGATAWQNDMT